MRNSKMQVRDVQTGEIFSVDPGADAVRITTRDGQVVKVFPASMTVMVKKGQRFDGVTPRGPRPMELLR